MIEARHMDVPSQATIEAFLRSIGWKLMGRRSAAALYNLAGEVPIEVVVPATPTASNIAPLYRTLSQLMSVSEADLNFIIRSVRFDILRSKVPDRLVINDSVSLSLATDFIFTQRRLLTATATVQIDPVPYYRRVLKDAVNYVDKCRFGHTFRGSFGFAFESPVPEFAQLEIGGIEAAPPFERKVFERLARGLQTIDDAVIARSVSPIQENYTDGLNANICEELIALSEILDGADIFFDFTWSPQIRPPKQPPSEKTFILTPRKVEILQDAARNLRIEEANVERSIYGLVYQLRSEGNPNEDLLGEREVVVRWLSEDRGQLNVHVILPAEEYLQAVGAHHDGLPVAVTGVLAKRGRYWFLDYPSQFVVLKVGK